MDNTSIVQTSDSALWSAACESLMRAKFGLNDVKDESWPEDLGSIPTFDQLQNIPFQPPIINGGGCVSLTNFGDFNSLCALFFSINRFHTRGLTNDVVLKSSNAGRLILLPNGINRPYSKTSKVLVEAGEGFDVVAYKIRGNDGNTYPQISLSGANHVGYYDNEHMGTDFYWLWFPFTDLESGEIKGGRIEIVGHMSHAFRKGLSNEITVRKCSG